MILLEIHQTSEIEKNAGDKQKLTVSAVSKVNNFQRGHPTALKMASF